MPRRRHPSSVRGFGSARCDVTRFRPPVQGVASRPRHHGYPASLRNLQVSCRSRLMRLRLHGFCGGLTLQCSTLGWLLPAASSAGWQAATFLMPGAFFSWLSAVRKSFPSPLFTFYLLTIYVLAYRLSLHSKSCNPLLLLFILTLRLSYI